MTPRIPDTGWMRIGPDPGIRSWADAALPLARSAVASGPDLWRCGGTWFPGVDALPNTRRGEVDGVGLPSSVCAVLPVQPKDWHRAQISTILPGYPQPWEGESEAAFGYRVARDAAHVDGLLPVGPEKRRMVREPHAFILGLPLTGAMPGAAPLVVWEGSQAIMRRAFAEAFRDLPPGSWPDVDVTDAYHAARREVFATCRRVELAARPGEALLLHRLILHGMAPWAKRAEADPEGRMIAYFRPEFSRIEDWLGFD
jgi:hypothetical protein